MSTKINTAVTSSLNTFAQSAHLTGPTYQGYVESAGVKVVEAVTEQVEQIVESLRSRAEENGLAESLVENALIAAGLVDEPVADEPETLEQKVDRLLTVTGEQGAAIAALLAAAKANGIDPARYSA